MYAIRTAHILNAKYQKQLTVNMLKIEPYLNEVLITNTLLTGGDKSSMYEGKKPIFHLFLASIFYDQDSYFSVVFTQNVIDL